MQREDLHPTSLIKMEESRARLIWKFGADTDTNMKKDGNANNKYHSHVLL